MHYDDIRLPFIDDHIMNDGCKVVMTDAKSISNMATEKIET